MKLLYRTANGRMTVELEADSQTELWEELAAFQEVFEEQVCGKCSKNNFRSVVRQDSDENKYYELHCLDCKAKLAYGAHKKGGGLFPARFERKDGVNVKDKDGKNVPRGKNGWTRWNFEKKVEE